MINDKYKKHILISKGRSGSSFINTTLAAIFNLKYKVQIGKELLGEGESVWDPGLRSPPPRSRRAKLPVKLVNNYFNSTIKKYPNSNHCSIQWKPCIINEKYMALFPYIKKKNIKILINYRNPLHIFISGIKHRTYNVNAHYQIHDKEGLKKVRNLSFHLQVSDLIKYMEDHETSHEMYINLLEKNSIPYLKIDYDEVSSKNIDAWIKIIKFLDPEVKINNTFKKKIKNKLNNPTYEKTTIKKDWDLILNYDEVLKALIGTKFEKYIEKKLMKTSLFIFDPSNI